MKVYELLENKTTIEDLIARLERVGGKVYAEITKGDQVGKLGVNGKGKLKVYFAFYPDGTSQRFEHMPRKEDLKAGWKAQELRDPETVEQDEIRAVSTKKAQDHLAMFEKEISLSDAELAKVCRANGIHMGPIVDAWVEEHGTDRLSHLGNRRGERYVAWAIYTITLKNED